MSTSSTALLAPLPDLKAWQRMYNSIWESHKKSPSSFVKNKSSTVQIIPKNSIVNEQILPHSLFIIKDKAYIIFRDFISRTKFSKVNRLLELKSGKTYILRRSTSKNDLAEMEAEATKEYSVLFNGLPGCVQFHFIAEYKSKKGLQQALIMDHYSGGNLFDFLQDPPLEASQRVQLCMGAIQGIAEMHRRDIVHGDIKLENIFWEKKNNRSVIGDYGSCRPVNSFTAPIFTSTHRSIDSFTRSITSTTKGDDIWALGIVLADLILLESDLKALYALLTATRMMHEQGSTFALQNLQEAHRDLIQALMRHKDPMLHLIASMLDEDPRKRPSIGNVLAFFTDRFPQPSCCSIL